MPPDSQVCTWFIHTATACGQYQGRETHPSHRLIVIYVADYPSLLRNQPAVVGVFPLISDIYSKLGAMTGTGAKVVRIGLLAGGAGLHGSVCYSPSGLDSNGRAEANPLATNCRLTEYQGRSLLSIARKYQSPQGARARLERVGLPWLAVKSH